jgi:hypothetical protein
LAIRRRHRPPFELTGYAAEELFAQLGERLHFDGQQRVWRVAGSLFGVFFVALGFVGVSWSIKGGSFPTRWLVSGTGQRPGSSDYPESS